MPIVRAIARAVHVVTRAMHVVPCDVCSVGSVVGDKTFYHGQLYRNKNSPNLGQLCRDIELGGSVSQ